MTFLSSAAPFLDLVDLRSNIHSWRGLTSRTWRWTSSQLIGNRPGWPWTSTGHENTTSGFYSSLLSSSFIIDNSLYKKIRIPVTLDINRENAAQRNFAACGPGPFRRSREVGPRPSKIVPNYWNRSSVLLCLTHRSSFLPVGKNSLKVIVLNSEESSKARIGIKREVPVYYNRNVPTGESGVRCFEPGFIKNQSCFLPLQPLEWGKVRLASSSFGGLCKRNMNFHPCFLPFNGLCKRIGLCLAIGCSQTIAKFDLLF